MTSMLTDGGRRSRCRDRRHRRSARGSSGQRRGCGHHGARARDVPGQARRPRRAERRHDRRALRGAQRHGDGDRRDRRRAGRFTGDVLGQVDQELALAVAQRRLDLQSAADGSRRDRRGRSADARSTSTRKSPDSTRATARRRRRCGVLCAAGQMLRAKPSAAALAETLNGVVAAIRQKKDK